MNATLPLEIFLHIFPYLSIDDIFALRQTCKTFLAMTRSRSVWSILYKAYVLERDIPAPRLNGKLSLESLDAEELENYTIRALRLRRNWTAPSPRAVRKQEVMVAQETPTRVIGLHFLPGREARWLISVHHASIEGRAAFIIRNWDVTSNPPVLTASLTVRHFAGLAINTDPEHPLVLAVQCPHLEIYSIDFSGSAGFHRVRSFPNRQCRLLAFTGNTIISKPGDDGVMNIFTIDSPVTEAKLLDPVHPQPVECHGAIIHEDFVILLRATSIEIYDLFILRNADTDDLQPRQLEPVTQHKWPWRIDSSCMVQQVSYAATERKGLPPVYILARFKSWFPWPVNILHHFELTPNRAYDSSMVVSQTNLPYILPLPIVQTIASPVRLFSTTHMALGTYGTAIWIDTHTEDYFNPDCGQRLAGHCLNTVELEEGLDIPQTTMASIVFDLNERDTWVHLALDEAEGRVVVGHSTGEITLYDYT